MDQRYLFPGLMLTALAPVSMVVAADYFDIGAVQKAIYPEADSFQELVLQLTPAQLQSILEQAGAQPTHGAIRLWRVTRDGALLGHLFTDEVIGRQNLISYALGIDASGRIRGLEIMAYRESHGGEIRNPAWRGQFAQRSGLDQLKFRTDIKNISGATLSSEHVTQGVRWLVAMWQAALKSSDVAA
jgi:Na+-translocating ferredoxin:NAD+ oxidoreductase RnfG subunit